MKKRKKAVKKNPTSFRFEKTDTDRLAALCEDMKRERTQIIQILIEQEFKARGL